jgi:hypothetical protein
MSFLEDIKRPFNLLTFVIAIASLSVAFYFYYFPRNNKEIAYTASKPSLIFDNSVKSPNLTLVDSSGHQIAANTYLMSFTFWNSGSQPIEPGDIRHPITVSFPKSERILDQKITITTDQEVGGFSLSAITNESLGNAIQLRWNHFDPRKGTSFQVIFCQTNEPKPAISADIVGLKGLNFQQKRNSKESDFFLKILFAVLFILTSLLFWLKFKTNVKFAWFDIPDVVFPLIFLALIGYTIIRDALILSPPF